MDFELGILRNKFQSINLNLHHHQNAPGVTPPGSF